MRFIVRSKEESKEEEDQNTSPVKMKKVEPGHFLNVLRVNQF